MTLNYGCTAAISQPKLNPDRVNVVKKPGKGFKFTADAMNVLSINDGANFWNGIQCPEQNCGHGFIRELDFGLDGHPGHAGHGGRHGEWTEEAICILHEEVLKRAVHALDDKRTSPKTKESILDWISEDDDRPFSFRICAILSGCDPEKLRDQIVDLVRRLKKWRMAA
jgi:hypothetical protein